MATREEELRALDELESQVQDERLDSNSELDALNVLEDQVEEERLASEMTTLGYGSDVLKGTGGGIAEGISETFSFLADIDDWSQRNLGAFDLNPFDAPEGTPWYQTFGYISPSKIREFEAQGGQLNSPIRIPERGFQEIADLIPDPETIPGNVVEVGSKLVVGFLGAGKIKAVGTIRNFWTRNMLKGALVDLAVFDAHEERLSNLIEEVPALQNPVTEYLAADADDSALEGRMKNAIEGAGLSVIADTIISSVRAIRAARRTKIELEAELVARDADDAIEAELKATAESPAEDFGFKPESEELVDVATKTETPASSFLVEDGTEGLRVVPKDDTLDATLDLLEDEDTVSVLFSGVAKEARGRRIGIEMYIEGIEYALAKGKQFTSDKQLSIQARRVWRALEERGYVIEKNTNLHPPTERGAIHTTDGNPLFRVVGKVDDTLSPSVARVPQADPKLATSSADDVETLVEKINTKLGGNGTTPEPILRALETGDVRHILDELGPDRLLDVTGDPDAVMAMVDKLGHAILELARRDPNYSAQTVQQWIKTGLAGLSDNLAVDLTRIYSDFNMKGGMAARLVGSALAIGENFKSLADDIRKLDAGSLNPTQLEQAMIRLEELHVFGAMAKGNASGAGRALRAIREQKKALAEGAQALKSEAEKLEDDAMKRALLDQVAEFIRTNDLEGVIKALRMSGWARAEDALRQVGYGNMLSSLSTHKANFMGSAWRLAAGLFIKPLEFAGGQIRKGFNAVNPLGTNAGKEFTSWDEVVGFWTQTTVGWDAGMRGFSHLLVKAVDKINPASAKFSLKEWAEESKELGNVWKTVITGTPVTDSLTRIGDQPLKQAFNAEELFGGTKFWEKMPEFLKKFMAAPIDFAGKAYQIPQRIIVGTDEMFKTIAFEQNIGSKAWSEFGPRIRNGEMSVTDAVSEVSQHTKNVKAAVDFAREQTFMKDLPGWLGKFEAAVRGTPMGWVVAPFIRTPWNLFAKSFELLGTTPLVQTLAGKPGKARDAAIGRLIFATGFTGSAAMLAMNGRLRGSGNRNNSEDLRGVEPYSIRIGDTWHQFNRLDPMGMVLGLIADINDGWANLDEAPTADHWTFQMFGITAASVAQNMTSKTFMRGINDFMELMTEDDEGMSSAKWARWLASSGTNLLPFVGSNIERRTASEMDEYSRWAFTVMDQLKLRSASEHFGIGAVVDGDRQDLGIRRDALGRPVKEKLGFSTISKTSVPSSSILDHILADMNMHLSMPARSFEKGKVRMDTVQYSRLVELRGQVVQIDGANMEQYLTQLVTSQGFNSLPTFEKETMISQVFSNFGRLAKQQLLVEYPEIDERIGEAKEFVRTGLSAAAAGSGELQGKPSISQNPIQSLIDQQSDSQAEVIGQYQQ